MKGLLTDFELRLSNATNLSVAYVIEKSLFQSPSKEAVRGVVESLNIAETLNESIRKIYCAFKEDKELYLNIDKKHKELIKIELHTLDKVESEKLVSVVTENIINTYLIPAYRDVLEHSILDELIPETMAPYIQFSTEKTTIKMYIVKPIIYNSDVASTGIFVSLGMHTFIVEITCIMQIVKDRAVRSMRGKIAKRVWHRINLNFKQFAKELNIENNVIDIEELGNADSKAVLICERSAEEGSVGSILSSLDAKEMIAWCDAISRYVYDNKEYKGHID